ncbi:hypothetical protein V2P32_00875 [Mycoplasma sp. 06067-C1-B144P-99-0482-3]|uniref:hypothetical protein n=1 Tax=Mycoplasma sp. 06067-C1-B144P-99-0482-3 TaxID=3117438 RepID=UPI003DA3A017
MKKLLILLSTITLSVPLTTLIISCSVWKPTSWSSPNHKELSGDELKTSIVTIWNNYYKNKINLNKTYETIIKNFQLFLESLEFDLKIILNDLKQSKKLFRFANEQLKLKVDVNSKKDLFSLELELGKPKYEKISINVKNNLSLESIQKYLKDTFGYTDQNINEVDIKLEQLTIIGKYSNNKQKLHKFNLKNPLDLKENKFDEKLVNIAGEYAKEHLKEDTYKNFDLVECLISLTSNSINSPIQLNHLATIKLNPIVIEPKHISPPISETQHDTSMQ